MSPEEFRKHGKQVIDWIADYLASVESHPVRSPVGPGDIRRALPSHPPEHGEPFEHTLADLDRVLLPGITHWQHPRFFAYFPANASGPAILGDLLSSGLGVQGMLWATSPAATELETVVVDWLAELLDLPRRFRTDEAGGGVIQDSASSASLVALLAARQRAGAGRHTLYVSSQTHSSLERAGRIAGLGAGDVRAVEVDPDTLAMDPDRLAALLERDRADGAVPTLVCATIGTTATTAIDPVARIGEVCRQHGVWLHVDAAYAGVAAVCPELRWINDGVAAYADSYVTNPHKWLLTNFDCSVLWLADRAPLIDALSALPEYLRNPATSSGEVIDYRDWQLPLGRRFRALKLWAVLRWYGAEGLRAHIRDGIALADEFADLVAADPRFEVSDHHPFGLVCFRPRYPELSTEDANAATMALVERLNDSGELYLTHAVVGGRTVLRLAVGGPATQRRHVHQAWEAIRAAVS
ncbi:aminotransferase class V-fold PLP-dependent enzyme [Prauserella muralis]|uniref:Amino acid decarboxylase n=1 Tax=Prauserella muralis TaxID=588067 RepID=A0A2V4AZX2_9PSEU|nr:aminotransferase class V-fold PLP-dependent enzyme [Prauserella muralis]PXY21470.1 amino acid decarboxylase [Prauserella muralis]